MEGDRVACYSPCMRTATAPDLTPGYPSRGAKIGPAWTEAWTLLTQHPGEWLDGKEMWEDIGPRHDLNSGTLRALMFRMAKAGHLESESRQVITVKGRRSRTQFRYVNKEA